MHKLVLLAALAFFGFILWIIYLVDTAQQNFLIVWVNATPYGDKIGHMLIFGFLTLGINIGLKFKVWRVWGRQLYVGTVVVTLFALVEECSQYYFPNRTLDMQDLLADAMGIALFTGISYYLARRNIFR